MARLPATVAVLCLWTTMASAQPLVTNYWDFTMPAGVAVPDGNISGLALNTGISGIDGTIAKLTVSLDISGGFNGDLYAYLRGPSGGYSVLLNRSGVTGGDSFGYSNTGFNVTFDDSAGFNNIHYYQTFGPPLNGNGQLTGTWASDGRDVDPRSAPSLFDTTAPSLTLNSFDGNYADGTWTLFLADLSAGEQSTLVSWNLSIETVPEPSTAALLALGILLGLRKRTALSH